MIALNAGDIVFNPGWTNIHLFTVGTVEAYAAQYNEDPAMRVERALERGHAIAWANKISACIDDSGTSGLRHKANAARAIALEPNQQVVIEGRVYATKLVGKQYSDGIKFTPVVGA